MPHKYDIETKAGKFTVESDNELTSQQLVEYANKASAPEPDAIDHAASMGIGAAKGLGDLVNAPTIIEGAKTIPGIVKNLAGDSPLSLKDTVMEGLKGSGEAAINIAKLPYSIFQQVHGRNAAKPFSFGAAASAVDPAKGTEDPWEANTRRATNALGLLVGPKAITKLGELSNAARAAKVAEAATEAASPALKASGIVTGTKFGLPEVPAVPEVPPGAPGPRVVTSSSKGVTRTMPGAEETPGVPGVPAGPVPITPVAPRFTFGRPVSPASVVSGSAEVPRNISMPGVVGPNKFSMSVAGRTAGVVPEAAGEGAANAAMKSEAAGEAAAAGRTTPPGREPVYGGVEQRSPTRVTGAAEDKAYRLVRQKLQEKAALERAKAGLITKAPVKASAPVAAPEPVTTMPLAAEGDVPPVIKGAIPDPGPVGATKGVLEGFTKQPTTPLSAMVEKYGKAGAAQRAGMSVEELEVRLEAGNDPAKLAKGLRDKLGAEKAGRALGMKAEEVRTASGGGPSKLPTKAVEAIKAAAAREKAATGSVSPQTQTLLDRIKSESGFANARLFAPVAGSVAGGTLGLMSGDGESDKRRVTKGLMGLLAGGATGAALTNPGNVLRGAQAARRELMLSGGAIPKNITQMMGNALYSSAEGKTIKPLKELMRAPTNWREYKAAMMEGDPYSHGTIEPLGPGAGTSPLRFAQPSHHIGAIDKMDTAMLRRAGMNEHDIPRYMMNADEDVIRAITNHPVIPEALRPTVKIMARIGFPFTRFATNQLAGTAAEAAHVLQSVKNLSPNMRAALDVASVGGGVGLGKWAGDDPKKRLIATMLMPLFGPAQGLATVGAITSQGTRGLGGGAFGGLSPLPEQGLQPQQFVDPKSWFGFKPAALSVVHKLAGK